METKKPLFLIGLIFFALVAITVFLQGKILPKHSDFDRNLITSKGVCSPFYLLDEEGNQIDPVHGVNADKPIPRSKPAENATDEELFNVIQLPEFTYKPVKGSFNKAACEVCGEYVFERYLRVKDGKRVCIPCAGHEPDEKIFYHPEIG
jgi:hypothetical protein